MFAALVLGVSMPAACGSDDPRASVSGDEASVVTVAGDEAPSFEPGDDRPVEEVDVASVVTVIVDRPDGVELFGTAIVALEDVSLSDAPSIEIARVEVPTADLAAMNDTVEIFLPLPLDGSIDVTATVHIDTDESGTFSQGDWISPELIPVTPSTQSGLIAGLVRI